MLGWRLDPLTSRKDRRKARSLMVSGNYRDIMAVFPGLEKVVSSTAGNRRLAVSVKSWGLAGLLESCPGSSFPQTVPGKELMAGHG